MGLFNKISITPEVTAVGALEDLPDVTLSVNHTVKSKRLVSNSEFAYKKVIYTSTSNVTRYDIQWNPVTKAEMETIRDFWDTHQGGIVPFLWNGPSSQFTAARKFHFSGPMTISKIAPNVYSVSVTVEEIF